MYSDCGNIFLYKHFVSILQIADEILHKKMDTTMSYMAAHTMRNKIQSSFHEVPLEAHASLRVGCTFKLFYSRTTRLFLLSFNST